VAAQPDEHRIVSGIIHVGANLGQEIPSYLKEGKVPVLAFEPLGDVYKEACEIHAEAIEDGRVMLVNCALSDRNGTLDMTVAMNKEGGWETLAASGLGVVLPGAARRLGWQGWLGPVNTKIVPVRCFRFDDWALANQMYPPAFDTLVVDVQGMELEVLKGFGANLQNLQKLVVECSEQPVYAGEATAYDVIGWLQVQGFRRQTDIGIHGDIEFAKEAV
jgi:FkbM family methyltransferase